MKHLRYLTFFLFTASAMALLPRSYQQAEILPRELNLTISTSAEVYSIGFFDSYDEGIGQNIQITGRWAAKSWESFALFGCIGGMVSKGYGYSLADFEPVASDSIGIFPNVGLGLHWEFVERPTFALQFTAEFPTILSLTLLSGINSRRLDREVVTIGIKSMVGLDVYVPILPVGAFVNVHPTPRLHVMGGLTYLWMIGGEFHLGLGYTFGRLGGEE